MADPQSPASPSSSCLSYTEPSLEQLVVHFVAAKRSLSATAQVWRANEIVTAARVLLEENAVLNAKNAFVRSGLEAQIEQLRAVRHGVELVGVEGQEEFNTILHALDESYLRLSKTLETLQTTPIEASFQPSETEQKHLYDFIDSGTVDTLRASLEGSIDRTREAEGKLSKTLATFDGSLSQILSTLPGKEYTENASSSPLPDLFHDLSGHATECATALQSLVRHYDLCLTALKHTEGGFSAAREATASNDPSQPDLGDFGSLHQDAPPEPMSASERLDMLIVLSKDADEVDDVTGEIRDRINEMEAQLQEMEAYVQTIRDTHARLLDTYSILRKEGSRLPAYLASAQEFLAHWGEEKAKLEHGITEVEGLREFYEGFLEAYDGLIVEVGRRRNVQVKMERIARKALGEVEKLYQEDLSQRETFKSTQGDFLPSDIWPGLVNPPLRYQMLPEGEGEFEVPAISKEVLEAAIHRVRSRM